jgi:histidine triad (HIT) family protein
MNKKDCIFCKIARKEIPVNVIYESENFIAFPDANPKVEGHTLIIPKNHYENLIDFPSFEAGELFDVIKSVAEIKIKDGAEGFNILQNNFSAAGQVVMHTHVHLLPRKNNDNFNLRV